MTLHAFLHFYMCFLTIIYTRKCLSFLGGLLSLSQFIVSIYSLKDRLCGLVVSVSGYRCRGLGFDSRRYQIFLVVVGLERGPLSLVRSVEELLE